MAEAFYMRHDTRTLLLAVLGIPFALSVAWAAHAVSPVPVDEEVACETGGEPEVLSAETEDPLPSPVSTSVVPEETPVTLVASQPLFVAEPVQVVYEEVYEEDEQEWERDREDEEEYEDDDRREHDDREDEHEDD